MINRFDDGTPEPLYAFVVPSDRLRAFCDRVQVLPHTVLPTVLDGLYRSRPFGLAKPADRTSVGSAFSDQAYLGPRAMGLRCTWRMRRILEEYGFGCGPFYPCRPEAARWLAAGRFVHGRSGEFWAVAYCLRLVGAQAMHRCVPPRR
jgi:hypothetical protein